MTLNITIASERCIYQSADFRLIDVQSGKHVDAGTNQKIFLVIRGSWHASVCYCGVGSVGGIRTTEWLADRIATVRYDDPVERLVDELLLAQQWLMLAPHPHNRHSFSIGAFVGSEPRFLLVSNYEACAAPPKSIANTQLSVSESRPTRPRAYISGQPGEVARPERRRLERLVEKDTPAETVYAALAKLNSDVAGRNPNVSPGCFTNHVRRTGEGGGQVHDIEVPATAGAAFSMELPPQAQAAVTDLLDRQFGPGKARLRSMATARSEPTEDFHRTQLRDKPLDASAHSNYGAYLKDRKQDSEGAERAYERALELDPQHTNALGNLANLRAEQGNHEEAERLYARALAVSPINENAAFNFARFLLQVKRELVEIRRVLDDALTAHPQSARLHLLTAEVDLLDRNAPNAIERCNRARDLGGKQSEVEPLYAIALHVSAAPFWDCIAAYRTAIAVSPKDPNLHLNLAQLLFLVEQWDEGNTKLREALQLGLDVSAQLEAQVYRLTYGTEDTGQTLAEMQRAMEAGGRLAWNVTPNIDQVRSRNPARALALEQVCDVLRTSAAGRGAVDLVGVFNSPR